MQNRTLVSRSERAAVTLLQAAAMLFVMAVPQLSAGLGPENVVVVVNSNSESSKRIADEYVRLREIPSCNVVSLTDVPDAGTTDVATFRAKLLTPVMEAIDERGLQQQIDCVAWSSDFPTAINVRSDIGKRKLPRVFTPVASLNGLTYLHEFVLKKDLRYLTLESNAYARRLKRPAGFTTLSLDEIRLVTTALSTAAKEKDWTGAVETVRTVVKSHPGNPDLHYNLACCLARTDKPDEAVSALKASIEAGWWNRRHAERDEDLKNLRGRDDFRQALDEMGRQRVEVQPTRAFSSRLGWGNQGEPVQTGGSRYLLSTVLAVTRGRGTTIDEAIGYLRRSREADGTRPEGTIYFMRNGNIRSTARDSLFASAVASLKEADVRAEIRDGILPKEARDVQGVMVGTASLDWKASGSRIQPGAICEHFTSFGGIMRANAGQTPLTEFLRHGAAGASGTVTEPFAIPAKFPDPFIHAHYARGCCLAEAFYQSVSGPYQLLIVGDPLCQPWARFLKLSVGDLTSGQSVSGLLEVTPKADGEVSRFELFVDGRFEIGCRQGRSLQFDTKSQPDGKTELRIVAVSTDPVETRSRLILPVAIRNGDR